MTKPATKAAGTLLMLAGSIIGVQSGRARRQAMIPNPAAESSHIPPAATKPQPDQNLLQEAKEQRTYCSAPPLPNTAHGQLAGFVADGLAAFCCRLMSALVSEPH